MGVVEWVVTAARVVWDAGSQFLSKRERARASVGQDRGGYVLVVNTGQVAVYLAGVDLVVEGKTYPLQTVLELGTLPVRAGDLKGATWQLTGETERRLPLQPGDRERFVLDKASAPNPASVMKANPRRVWIIVRSTARTLCRLPWRDVYALLAATHS